MKTTALMLALLVSLPALCWQGNVVNKQKIKGLREYARQGSPAIPKITPYLADGDVEVRREAVKALVEAGSQRSLEPLTAACADNDAEVQIRATDGLVNFYLPGYVDRGLSASIRRAGGLATGRWDEGSREAIDADTPLRPEIVQALSGLARGGVSMESRANAARALGILRARAGVPVLVESLKSKDSRLMYESLVALQKTRDRSAGPNVAFLMRDLDEKVQLAAIETAGILGSKEAVPGLKRVLENPANRKVRRATLIALAQIGDPANRPLFLSLLGDKDEEARAAAAEGLGRLAEAADRPAVEKAWTDEKKTSPRLAQAFALALLGNVDPSSFGPVGYLANNLNQKAWRGVALPYLSELSLKPEPRSAILVALGQATTRDEKTGLAQALAGCGSRDALAGLEGLSKDEDAAVAREALRALRILKGSVR
ncbi:MAG: HEAT repeat domain-containing protein [Candidatus Solibacter usitatus]|nr:HEAT repeat domain-containing protein [Candidatus Solibacter usitatus]